MHKLLQCSETHTPQSTLSLNTTPKVFSYVLKPVTQLLSGDRSPSPVALETSSRLALCSRHSRVFGLSIRRLPNRRKLVGRLKEPLITIQQAVTRIQRWYKNLLRRRKAVLKSDCALRIQRTWRGYYARRQVATVLRTRERVSSWVQGWKTRRIFRLRCMQRLIAKIKRAGSELQPALKARFNEKWADLWPGKWVLADTCLKLYASPAASTPHPPSSACKTECSAASTESSYSPFPCKPDLSIEGFLLCERLAAQPSPRVRPSVLPTLGRESGFVKSLQKVERMETFRELRTLLERERRLWLV